MADGLPRIIVIVEDAGELDRIVATLRGRLPLEVFPARSPAEALRWEGYREAPLVLYDCAPTVFRARHLRDLFTQACLVALAGPGCEDLLVEELETGAADYVIRDPARAYLRLLPLKVTRILAPRNDAPGARFIARLEDSLARSEIRFGTLVQAIPDIVYHLDPQGYFIFVNDAVSMLEYSPSDIIGRHFSIIVHPDDLPHVSRTHALKRLREGERVGTDLRFFDERRSGERRAKGLVVRLMTKPGGSSGTAHRLGDVVSYGVIEAVGHYDGGPELLPGADGDERADAQTGGSTFLGTVGIIHDITLHRRSEEMMRILLQSVDQSPLAMLVTDAAGVVQYANPYFLREARLEPDLVMGRNVANLTESARLGGLFRILADTVRQGDEWRGRLPGPRDGVPWDHLYVSPVRDPQSRTTHYIAILSALAEADKP